MIYCSCFGAIVSGCSDPVQGANRARDDAAKSVDSGASGFSDSGANDAGIVRDSGPSDSGSKPISLKHPGPCTEQVDTNGDGSNDSVRTSTYDAEGHLSSVAWDEGANGTFENRTTYRYNARGLPIERLVDDSRPSDGVFDYRLTYSYNAAGQLVGESEDFGNNGSIERFMMVTPGPHGPAEIQWDDVGTATNVDGRDVHSYDGAGHRVRLERHAGHDGPLDFVFTYTYQGDNLVTETKDYKPIGSIDESITYTHDERGNPLTSANDQGADGSINVRSSYTYECFPTP